MGLEIQKMLRINGLEKTVSDLKLICKKKDDLVLLKYSQIESDFSLIPVQECRGLILDMTDNWNVVCLTFKKFFNAQEGFAHVINWNTAKVLTKYDGSLIQMYFYKNEWHCATSGTIDAMTEVNGCNKTFNQLVWETVNKYYNLTKDDFTSKLNSNYCYAFEICTPYNIVVSNHGTSSLYLLSKRNKITLIEESIDNYSWLTKPQSYSLNNIDEIAATFEEMTWQEEGYIVCDNNFNRIKVKNPKYCAVHHLKSGVGPQYIMGVVKDNELSEFCVYFKEHAEEAYYLKNKYDALANYLESTYKHILNSGEGFQSQKEYAALVMSKVNVKFQGLMFALKNKKYESAVDWLYYQDNKWLYYYLSDKKI